MNEKFTKYIELSEFSIIIDIIVAFIENSFLLNIISIIKHQKYTYREIIHEIIYVFNQEYHRNN